MIRTYSEKLMEDIIKDFPFDFLGANMTVVSQQPIYHGFRPDLIFRDEDGILVVVELQLEALDRTHFYKTLEYRDYIREIDEVDVVRMMIICNSIPDRFIKLLKVHAVECKAIPKVDFINLCKKLKPNLVIKDNVNVNKVDKPSVTSDNILRRLLVKAESGKNVVNFNARIFWCPGWSIYEHDEYLHLDLEKIANINAIYHKGWIEKNTSSIQFKSNNVTKKYAVPNQIIISDTIDTFTDKDIRLYCKIVDFLGYLIEKSRNSESLELILGTRALFFYEKHITGNVREYLWFCDRYISNNKINHKVIDDDMKLLSSLIAYGGKYPDLRPIRLFMGYEISEGMGSLSREFESAMTYCPKENIEKWRNIINQNLFVTIKINDVSQDFVYLVQNFIKYLTPLASSTKLDFSKYKLTRRMKDIDVDALLLSTKYFADFVP